jgi:hypothetical protein
MLEGGIFYLITVAKLRVCILKFFLTFRKTLLYTKYKSYLIISLATEKNNPLSCFSFLKINFTQVATKLLQKIKYDEAQVRANKRLHKTTNYTKKNNYCDLIFNFIVYGTIFIN